MQLCNTITYDINWRWTRNVTSGKLLLERLGLHQRQGSNPTGSGSEKVPPLALLPCTDGHRWNSNPNQGPFVTSMALHWGHLMVVSLAEKVIPFVLPVCQGGHSASLSKASPFLTGPVWRLSGTTTVHTILNTLKRAERGGSLMRQSTNGPSHLASVGHKAWLKKWLSVRWLFIPWGGTVETRRPHQMHLVKLGVNKDGR